VYECNLKAAESGGARLLQNAKVKEYIANHQEKVAEKIDITAESVLRDAIRFRDIAFGDLPGIYERMVKGPETGEYHKVIDRLRQFNPTALGKALELIGRNKSVQAFRETVEVSHTHRLEQALARKSKEVEKAALERTLVLVE
jgi:phage terminase small subunit